MSLVEPVVSRVVQLLLYRDGRDRFDSLGDPRPDREVRDRCLGNPARWRQALEDLGVGMPDDVVDWDRLGELWEDRNVFAHRGGVADERPSRRRGRPAGSVLPLKLAAVQAATDDIGAIRFGLVAVTWVHFTLESAEVVTHAAAAPAIEALRGRASGRCCPPHQHSKASAHEPDDKVRAQVQLWLAIKACSGSDAIRQEVTTWNAEGLGPEYELARQVLMHHYSIVLDRLPGLIEAGAVTSDQLKEWPLFDRMRSEGLLDSLLAGEG